MGISLSSTDNSDYRISISESFASPPAADPLRTAYLATTLPTLYLVLAIVCNAIANICLKLGSQQFEYGLSRVFTDPLMFLKNGYVVVGVVFFAAALVLYTLVLARMNLSVAYPIMVSIGFVIVIGFSALFLREELLWWQWLGMVFVLSGVILLSKGAIL